MRRWIAPAVAALLITGCAGEPQPLPEPVGDQEREELADGRARFWPGSAPIEQGVTYRITVYTHCGLDYLLDFDGSFWVVESAPNDPHAYLEDPDEGVITLVSPDRAIYSSSMGAEFRLVRIEGPREVYLRA